MIQHKFRVAELRADLRVLPDIEHDAQRARELGLCQEREEVRHRLGRGNSKDRGNIEADRGQRWVRTGRGESGAQLLRAHESVGRAPRPLPFLPATLRALVPKLRHSIQIPPPAI